MQGTVLAAVGIQRLTSPSEGLDLNGGNETSLSSNTRYTWMSQKALGRFRKGRDDIQGRPSRPVGRGQQEGAGGDTEEPQSCARARESAGRGPLKAVGTMVQEELLWNEVDEWKRGLDPGKSAKL